MASFNPISFLLQAPVWQKPFDRFNFFYFTDKWYSYRNQGGKAHILVGIPLEAQVQFNLGDVDKFRNFDDIGVFMNSEDMAKSAESHLNPLASTHPAPTLSSSSSRKTSLKLTNKGK